jgi:hypothetical protein
MKNYLRLILLPTTYYLLPTPTYYQRLLTTNATNSLCRSLYDIENDGLQAAKEKLYRDNHHDKPHEPHKYVVARFAEQIRNARRTI